MKRFFAILLILALMLSLAACGSSEQKTPILDNAEEGQNWGAYVPGTSQTDDSGENDGSASEHILQFDSVGDVTKNQDETFFQEINEYGDILGQKLGDYCYIYNGRHFTDIRKFSAASASNSDKNVPFVTLSDEANFPTIDRKAGDQLVLVMSEEINERIRWNQPIDTAQPVYRLTFESYCVPIVWENGQPALFLLDSEYYGDMGYSIDEIEGINIYYDDPESTVVLNDPSDIIRKEMFSEALEVLGFTTYDFTALAFYTALEGSIIWGNPGDTISFGKYSGTEYNEFIIPFDARLYSGFSACELVPARTRDGYMLYDLSQLEPGIYAFLNKVFEIK